MSKFLKSLEEGKRASQRKIWKDGRIKPLTEGKQLSQRKIFDKNSLQAFEPPAPPAPTPRF